MFYLQLTIFCLLNVVSSVTTPIKVTPGVVIRHHHAMRCFTTDPLTTTPSSSSSSSSSCSSSLVRPQGYISETASQVDSHFFIVTVAIATVAKITPRFSVVWCCAKVWWVVRTEAEVWIWRVILFWLRSPRMTNGKPSKSSLFNCFCLILLLIGKSTFLIGKPPI